MGLKTVFFTLPGLNKSAPKDSSVFPSEVKPSLAGYKVQPGIWLLAFLLIGYIGLRALMED